MKKMILISMLLVPFTVNADYTIKIPIKEANIKFHNVGINPPVVDPVTPVTPPVTPTEPTVDPVTPPVTPTEPTVDPVTPPVTPTEPTVDPVTPPVTPTEPTVDPVTPPVTPTEPTVDPTTPVTPVDPTPPVVTPVEPSVPVENGNWIAMTNIYTDWVNVGDVYDYDEDPTIKFECKWMYNPAMTQKGVEFTDYRDCYQDQERSVTVVEKNDVTGATRNRQLDKKETQQIEVEEERPGVGTKVDFEEFTAPTGKATKGNLEIVGSYSMDGVIVGSPIINNKGSRLYFHFTHNLTDNTYLMEIIGKDDDTLPSSTGYEGQFTNSYLYINDINFINYTYSNGKVANIYLGSGNRTKGYVKNYSRFSAPITAAQFYDWYNNPSGISKIRFHLSSMQ